MFTITVVQYSFWSFVNNKNEVGDNWKKIYLVQSCLLICIFLHACVLTVSLLYLFISVILFQDRAVCLQWIENLSRSWDEASENRWKSKWFALKIEVIAAAAMELVTYLHDMIVGWLLTFISIGRHLKWCMVLIKCECANIKTGDQYLFLRGPDISIIFHWLDWDIDIKIFTERFFV